MPKLSAKTEQELTLARLLDTAGATEFGKKNNFDSITSYDTFSEQVPLQFYKDLESYINETKAGKADILWPGECNEFAVSAGTTGKGKHLPLTDARLASDRVFIKSVAYAYFRQKPNPFQLFGKHLSLPGTIEQSENNLIGEISGFSALQTPLWLKPFQLENPHKLTQLSFQEKFDLLLQKALERNLKVITAVPSWILTLFQQALKETGKDDISEVWPNLALIVCGGMKLSNYRMYLEKLMGSLQPDFIETYGASEGYFAFSDDLQKDDLRLVTDNGIFYEFIQDPLPDEDAMAIQDTIPLWKTETGIPYAVVVSTNSGLWRYALRDIIEFTSLNPPRIKVKGRVSEMLDDFGEGLYIFEAEEALHKAAQEMNLQAGNFTIIPQLRSEFDTPCHYWLVQFTEPIHPDTLKRFAKALDKALCDMNRHYAIRRQSDALNVPEVSSISQQDINRWMEASDKARAQGKLPKVLRENVDLFLK